MSLRSLLVDRILRAWVDQRVRLAIPVLDDALSYLNIGQRPIGTINRYMASVSIEG